MEPELEGKQWWLNFLAPWYFNVATGAALLILAQILDVVLRAHYATNDGGWTTTQYDFVWVLGAACWICGVIFVLIGLIRLWRKPPETNKPEA
jgi:putative copper export protein